MKDFNSYFESIPELETERLRLTAFTREDMDAYFDILRDPKVQKYLGGGVPVRSAVEKEDCFHLVYKGQRKQSGGWPY